MRFWRNGGMNAYHVTQDVYPAGEYYANDTAVSDQELRGFVIGGRKGSIGPTPTLPPTPTPTPAGDSGYLQTR